MEGSLKNRLIIILGILSLIFLVIAVTSCNRSMQQDSKRKAEILKRMNAEESVSNLSRDKEVSLKKIDTLTKELAAAKSELETAQKSLKQEQLVNQGLKDEVLKLTKIKEKLEADLKEALIAARAAQTPLPKK
jgi:predicted Holliday junction resolvase-like endonuclease